MNGYTRRTPKHMGTRVRAGKHTQVIFILNIKICTRISSKRDTSIHTVLSKARAPSICRHTQVGAATSQGLKDRTTTTSAHARAAVAAKTARKKKCAWRRPPRRPHLTHPPLNKTKKSVGKPLSQKEAHPTNNAGVYMSLCNLTYPVLSSTPPILKSFSVHPRRTACVSNVQAATIAVGFFQP